MAMKTEYVAELKTNYMKKIITIITSIISVLTITGLAWAADTHLQDPLSLTGATISPNDLLSRLAAGLIFAAGTLALTFTIFGGYLIMAAAGNEERYSKGKKMVVYSVLGMILSAASYTILSTVINILTNGAQGNYITTTILFDPVQSSSPGDLYGRRILGYLLNSLGAFALLVSIYGGALWMTAAGNEEKIGKAKKTLTYGVLGLAIILGSYGLINYVYQPFYRLLATGQTPSYNQGQLPEDIIKSTSDSPVVCFREAQQKINETTFKTLNYGGACFVEAPSDCVKQRSENEQLYKAGIVMRDYSSCDQIGSCVQKLPGNRFKNRVKVQDCTVEAFPPLTSKIDNKSRCPFDSLTERDTGCYADVEFIPGFDYPEINSDNKWACIRQESTQAFMTTLDSKCQEETSLTCAQTPTDGEYKAGTFYFGYKCSEIGYCKQNASKFDSCENGVPIGMCGPTTFSSIGKPTPPWGCSNIGGDYIEIDSECYVDVSANNWTSGKVCPPRLR